MRLSIIFLLLALLGLQYKLWLSDSSVRQLLHLKLKLATKVIENTKSAARNTAVAADIAELKSGDQALEEHARYELGMVKTGETYYEFID